MPTPTAPASKPQQSYAERARSQLPDAQNESSESNVWAKRKAPQAVTVNTNDTQDDAFVVKIYNHGSVPQNPLPVQLSMPYPSKSDPLNSSGSQSVSSRWNTPNLSQSSTSTLEEVWPTVGDGNPSSINLAPKETKDVNGSQNPSSRKSEQPIRFESDTPPKREIQAGEKSKAKWVSIPASELQQAAVAVVREQRQPDSRPNSSQPSRTNSQSHNHPPVGYFGSEPTSYSARSSRGASTQSSPFPSLTRPLPTDLDNDLRVIPPSLMQPIPIVVPQPHPHLQMFATSPVYPTNGSSSYHPHSQPHYPHPINPNPTQSRPPSITHSPVGYNSSTSNYQVPYPRILYGSAPPYIPSHPFQQPYAYWHGDDNRASSSCSSSQRFHDPAQSFSTPSPFLRSRTPQLPPLTLNRRPKQPRDADPVSGYRRIDSQNGPPIVFGFTDSEHALDSKPPKPAVTDSGYGAFRLPIIVGAEPWESPTSRRNRVTTTPAQIPNCNPPFPEEKPKRPADESHLRYTFGTIHTSEAAGSKGVLEPKLDQPPSIDLTEHNNSMYNPSRASFTSEEHRIESDRAFHLPQYQDRDERSRRRSITSYNYAPRRSRGQPPFSGGRGHSNRGFTRGGGHHQQRRSPYDGTPPPLYPALPVPGSDLIPYYGAPQVQQSRSRSATTTYIPTGFDGFPVMAPPMPSPLPPSMPPVPTPITTLAFPLDPTRYYLLGQLEYYLSPQNMVQDFFLRQRMDAQGWIPISLIASFNRVRQLTMDVQLVRDVLSISQVVELRGEWVRMRGWEQFVLPNARNNVDENAPYGQYDLRDQLGNHENVNLLDSLRKQEQQGISPEIASSEQGGNRANVISFAEGEGEGEMDFEDDEEEDVVFVMGKEASGSWSADRRQP